MASKRSSTAERRTKTSRGRHPMLKDGSLYHRIFTQLKLVPEGLTAKEIAYLLIEEPSTVRGRLSEMRREGLVHNGHKLIGDKLTKVNLANITVETGFRRDLVEIESIIYVNEDGEYSVKSRIVGGLQTAAKYEPVPVQVVRHSVTVPKPEELKVSPYEYDRSLRDKRYDTIVIDHHM